MEDKMEVAAKMEKVAAMKMEAVAKVAVEASMNFVDLHKEIVVEVEEHTEH